MVVSITDISGTISDGNQITITGSGFGTTGPTILVFDDFEKGTNGNAISTAAGGAEVGQWTHIGDPVPRYSNSYAHGGSLSSRSNWEDNEAEEGGRWIGVQGTNFTKIYFSYWGFVPTGKDVPGTSIGLPNWKYWWVYEDPWPPVMDYVSATGSNFPIGSGGWYPISPLDGNLQNIPYSEAYGKSSTSFTRNQWTRWEVYILGHATSGHIDQWEMSATAARYSQCTNYTTQDGKTMQNYYDMIHFPAYGRGDTNSMTYYDDIYVAIGDGCLARVEIGNQSTLSTCTNLTPCTVDSWSAISIITTVRQGSFADQETGYLFVWDSDGNVNANGYEVTFGTDYNPQRTLFRP